MIRLWTKILALSMAFISFSACSSSAEDTHMYVEGAGGVPLAVTVTGKQDGPEILLLHGLGHGRESFQFQLHSDLPDRYRIAAFDLRGHGQSGKPWAPEGYADPAIWAEDVLNVMDAIGFKRPVIAAWSYGGLVAADLIRQTGSERVSGLMLVSSLAGMVTYTPDFSKGGAEMTEAYRLFALPSLKNQSRAISIVAPFLVAQQPAPPWPTDVQQLGQMLPPYVRPLLSARKINNADLLSTVNVPVLIVHGEKDAAIPQSAVEEMVAAARNIRAMRFDGVGHSPFAEAPAAFNKQLSTFTDDAWKENK